MLQSTKQETSDAPASVKETGLLAFIRRNQQRIGLVFTLAVFMLALLVCSNLVEEIDKKQLISAFSSVSYQALGLALLAAIISYLMIFGYEWSASHYADADKKLPLSTLFIGGLTGAAIGNALGFSMLTGGSVRYRLYSKKGLAPISIIQMTIFASLSLGTALPPIAALMAFTDMDYSAKALHINKTLLTIIASLILIGYAGALVLASYFISSKHPSKDSRSLNIGVASLRVPSMRLIVLQFIITFFDVIAASSVLYVLLPESVSSAVPFGTFLTVYLLALATGVLSHIPGGLGVFEAILLAAFGDSLSMAGLFAALLLYRLIYVILPLVVSCLALLVVEARRFTNTPQGARIASSTVPAIMALLVFICGVVLMFSNIAPSTNHLPEQALIPIPILAINIFHLAASLVGIICLVLTQGLWRRLSASWTLTVCALIIGSLLAMLKGNNWQVACLLAFVTCLLVTFRDVFYRPSRLFDVPCSPISLAFAACTIIISVWLFFFIYRDISYSPTVWAQLGEEANLSRALRAIAGSSIFLITVIIMWMLRSSPPKIHPPTAEDLEIAETIIQQSNQPNGYLVFAKDKDVLFHPEADTFIMYASHGRSLVALFDPTGNPNHYNEIIWQFRDFCDTHHMRPVFYQIGAENLPNYMDIGLTTLKLGEEAKLNLTSFDFASFERQNLREIWQRGANKGFKFVIHNKGEAPIEQLLNAAEAWQLIRANRERSFSIGSLTADYLQNFRMAVIYVNEQPIAFTNLLETNSKNLVTIDLIHIAPSAPRITLEYLMLGTIFALKEQQIEYFSLGLIPLPFPKPQKRASLAHRLGALVFRRSNHLHSFQGLRRFKDKLQPEMESLYMAIPAGLDPVIALTDTAALIAGELTELVRRKSDK